MDSNPGGEVHSSNCDCKVPITINTYVELHEFIQPLVWTLERVFEMGQLRGRTELYDAIISLARHATSGSTGGGNQSTE
jgi:hypothetical protein